MNTINKRSKMLRDDIMAVKKEVKQIKEQSVAMELLRDARNTNKRLFVIWIITFIAFIGLLGYTIWLLNDIAVEETTETYEVEQDSGDNGNNNFINGNENEVNN